MNEQGCDGRMHYISVSLWTQRNLQCHYNSRERITEALLHLRESVHLNIKKKPFTSYILASSTRLVEMPLINLCSLQTLSHGTAAMFHVLAGW